MKLMYCSSFDDTTKAGYYYAVNDRIEAIRSNLKVNGVFVNFNRKSKGGGNVDYNVWYPKVFNSHFPFSIFSEVYIFFVLLAIFLREKPNVIHVHWAYPIGYICVIISKIFKIKCIVHVHGSDVHSNPDKSKSIFHKTRYCLLNATKVFAVSNGLKDNLLKKFTQVESGKIIVTGNGVVVNDACPKVTSLDQDEIAITFVGNLNHTKGADMLPEIISKLDGRLKRRVKYYIVGTGELISELQKHLDKSNVFFFGHRSREFCQSIIKDSTLVLIPSRSEGFGLVAAEALTMGTPCMSFDIEGLDDVLELSSLPRAHMFDVESFVEGASIIINRNQLLDIKGSIDRFSIVNVVTNEAKYYE